MRKITKLLFCLAITAVTGAAQIVISLTVRLDPSYVPGHKEWMACTLIGPNVGKMEVCDKSDITNAQAAALIQSWMAATVRVFLEESSLAWLEENRPDELPADHRSDVDAEAAAKAAKELKRGRAVQ